MIIITRPDGSRFALNSDLIERADADPRTVLTLVDGSQYRVQETLVEVVERIRDFRASVVAVANGLEPAQPPGAPEASLLRLVTEP